MNPELEKHGARLQEALRLSTEWAESEGFEADWSGTEYSVLLRAAESLALMNWWMLQGSGAVEKEDLLRMQAQSQAVLLQLVHNAYAIGMQKGRASEWRTQSP